MREPEDWDEREVETPTSFFVSILEFTLFVYAEFGEFIGNLNFIYYEKDVYDFCIFGYVLICESPVLG